MVWEWDVILLFLLLALLAEVLGTVGAFGSSVFFVPLASFFMDFHAVLGLTALFHVSSNLSKIFLFRKGLDKKLILYLGIPAIVAVSFAAYFTQFLDTSLLELGLGMMLVALSLVFLLFPKLIIQPTKVNAVAGGVLSGGLAGFLGSGGPIRGITLAAFNLSKDVFVATSAVIDLGVDLSRSIVYTANGFVDRSTLFLIPFLIGVSFLGSYLGKRILDHIPQKVFKPMVLILILAIGILMLVNIWQGWR